MADVLPLNFPIPTENTTVSYDFVDFVSGRGYTNFYCGVSNDSTGDTYFLTTQTPNSSYNKRKFENSSINTYVEHDFDALFNAPLRVGGTAIISYTLQSGSGGLSTGNAKFEFFHVRGAVETAIGSITGVSNSQGGANQAHRLTTQATLSTTSFAVGDKLRVTVGVQNTANNVMGIWCDPASTSSLSEADTSGNPTIGTDLIIQVPFIIQQ